MGMSWLSFQTTAVMSPLVLSTLFQSQCLASKVIWHSLMICSNYITAVYFLFSPTTIKSGKKVTVKI
jgi:hypothetical protein